MQNPRTLIYDGSFNGFLTAVYIAFEKKLEVADIKKNNNGQNGLFSETETVLTHIEKAKRVWNVLHSKNHHALSTLYFAFLGEEPGIEMALFQYLKKILGTKQHTIWADEAFWTAKIHEVAELVAQEKKKVEQYISFRVLDDGMYFSTISPTFNILPLVSKYFRTKYADKQWSIYDTKRKYGLYCDANQVEFVSWCATDRQAV